MIAGQTQSAVPASTVAAPVFGRNGDVPRRDLSDTDCQSIINAEVSARALAATITFERWNFDAIPEDVQQTPQHLRRSVSACFLRPQIDCEPIGLGKA